MDADIFELAQAIRAGLVTAGENTIVEPGALYHGAGQETAPLRLGAGCRIANGAILYAGAQLGDGCEVGNYATVGSGTWIGSDTTVAQGSCIGAGVRIGRGNKILPYSALLERIEIGDENQIGPFISIGTPPQHLHPSETPGVIRIGSHNVLREYMTVHLPTQSVTSIGNHCYMMAYNHIPHDAQIGDYVILANSCQIGGHSYIQHHANLGLSCVLHQFSVIGAGAMVAMGSIVVKDIPPYVTFISGAATRLNLVGMQRQGKTPAEIESLRQLYARAHSQPLGQLVSQDPGAWWAQDVRDFLAVQKRVTCDFSRVGTEAATE